LKARFVFSADIELDEAIRYYDHQLPGLGFRFFQEVDAAIDRISFMPEAWTKIGRRTRRCLIKSFPYALNKYPLVVWLTFQNDCWVDSANQGYK